MAFTTYTKQQLQGGGRYIQKVKLGNWLEDQEINSVRRSSSAAAAARWDGRAAAACAAAPRLC